jgi:hypothetical protein
MLAESLLVVAEVAKVAKALDALGVRYVVGGCLASSLYGVPRSTQDVDVVASFARSTSRHSSLHCRPPSTWTPT